MQNNSLKSDLCQDKESSAVKKGMPLWILELEYVAAETFRTSAHWDSTYFHGRLGCILKEISPCPPACHCPGDECPLFRSLGGECSFAYLFRSPVLPGNHHRIKMDILPHPYLLDFPSSLPSHLNPGDTLRAKLILIGKGLAYLPVLVHAAEKLGDQGLGEKRNRLYLRNVLLNYPGQAPVPLYNISEGSLLPYAYSLFPWQDIQPKITVDTLQTQFMTPIALKSKRYMEPGEKTAKPIFPALLQGILRRVSTLMYHYAEWDLESEYSFKELLEKAETIQSDLSQCIHVPQVKFGNGERAISGYQGTVRYHGDLTSFLPWLRLGTITRVGSKIEYGLGKFVIN